MRVTSTVVVFSSLLIAAHAVEGGTTDTKAGTAKGSAKGSAAKGSGSGAGSSADPIPAATPGGGGEGSAATPGPGPGTDPATVKPEDMPTAVRMRRLEQKTQALKERAWQLKARVQMLKEQMLGGGVGAQAVIAHASDMGASFRLIKLIYSLDGTQVFARTDDTGESLYKTKSFDIFSGPIAPGNHQLVAVATYRGHGYGVFEYLSKYTFTAQNSQAFSASEGKISKVDCKGFEKGNSTVPLEKRASLECKITQVSPDRGGVAPTPSPTPAAAPATAPGK